jgi:hypothetical protein
MTDETPRPERITRTPNPRPPDREEIWDRFIDELDRQGQAGSSADVLVPTMLDPDAPGGKRFADLTRLDIQTLSKVAANLGRRGDVVKSMWEHTQQRLKQQKRDEIAASRRSTT